MTHANYKDSVIMWQTAYDDDGVPEQAITITPYRSNIIGKYIISDWVGGHYSHLRLTSDKYFQMLDYLRSKGYHIPYMGIDLFQEGIAIQKTK